MDEYKQSHDESDQVTGRRTTECQPCKKKNMETVAVFFCKEYKQFQCDDCIKVHTTFDFMSGPNVEASEAESPKPPFDMKGLDVCIKHQNKLEFFCVDHRVLCCRRCYLFEHRRCCEVNDLSARASRADLKADALYVKLDEVQCQANTFIAFVKENAAGSSRTSKLEPLLSQIDNVKNLLMIKCESLKTKLTEQFDKAEIPYRQPIEENKKLHCDILKYVDNYRHVLAYVFDQGTDEQKFMALLSIHKQISGFNRSLMKQKDNVYELELSVEYNKPLAEILKFSEDLATFVISKKKFNTPGLERAVHFSLVASVAVKQSLNDENEPLYTGIDFLPDGRLVLVDMRNRKLKVLSERLETLGMYKFSVQCFGVTVVSEEEIAVACGEDCTIEFLRVSKSSVVTWTRTIKTTSKLSSICLMDDTSFLVSTFEDKRPLRIVTMTGEEKDFGNIRQKECKSEQNCCTYVRNRDTVVLSDMNANNLHLMHLYGESGDMTTCVVTNDSIKKPRGVCVGPEDCIYICSNETGCLVQMSPAGKVIATHRLDIQRPRSVCISRNGKLMAVSNNQLENKTLHVYNIV